MRIPLRSPECRWRSKAVNKVLGVLTVAFSFSMTFGSGLDAFAQVNEQRFDIAEQPLGRALVEFSKQAELVFIAPTELFDLIQSNDVVGEYLPTDALLKLLDGTGYTGTITSGSTPTLVISLIPPPEKLIVEPEISRPIRASPETEPLSIPTLEEESVEEPDTEIIVVSGRLRRSLSSALGRKKRSETIVDAIIAEDIGKSTDQNIAEAINRVTGVAIDRVDGEGATISIRGAGPDLNIVTLNGVTLTSSGFNQSVDFSQFSADVLHAIEINKTPSADEDEGSLGATVRLTTFKPLDVQSDRRILEFQSRITPYNDSEGSGLDDYKISGSFSQRFLDDRLGVALVGALETASVRQDRYTATWFQPGSVDAAINANSIDQATFDPFNVDPNNVEILTEFDIDGDGTPDRIRGHQVRQSQYWYELVNRDRQTLTGAVQYKPTSDTDINASATYSVQDIERNQSFITNNSNVPTNNDALSIVYDPDTFTFLQNIYTSELGSDDQTGVIRNFGDNLDRVIRNQIYHIEAKHRVGPFTLALNSGYSSTTSEEDDSLSIRSFIPRNGQSNRGSGFSNGFSCIPNPEICRFILTPGLIDDTDEFELQDLQIRDQSIKDTAASVFFDVDWETNVGPFTFFEAGLKWTLREKDSFATSQNFRDVDVDAAFSDVSLSDFVLGDTPSDWGQRLGFPRDGLSDGWPFFDASAVQDFLVQRNGGLPVVSANPGGQRNIKQDIIAGYVKGNFSLFDERLSGDVGVRVARTVVDAEGFSSIRFRNANIDYLSPENIAFFGSADAVTSALGPFLNPDAVAAATRTQETNIYTNVLPSLNLAWKWKPDMIIRFAASQTIARPRIDSLNPAFNINELPFAAQSTAFFGATSLNPFQATNLDLSAEWYFDENSLLSIAFFNKSLSNFEETGQFRAFWRDFRSELFNADGNAFAEPNLIATPDNTLLPFDGGSLQAGCVPNREINLLAPVGPLGCDVVVVNQSRNGQGGFVRGIETTFQHNLTWAPSFLQHTGIAANYTFALSETDEETIFADDGSVSAFFPSLPLTGTSKHAFNSTVYYEDDRFLLRLAYNKRSDYLINRAERDGTAHWIEGADSLDLSSEFNITDNISFNFQAVNLTDSVRRVYSTNVTDPLLPTDPNALAGTAPTARTVELSNTGRIYRAGIRLNF